MSDKIPLPFRIALTMAKKSEYRPYKIGACLMRGSRVISGGFNQIKTHPITRRFENHYITGLHAEMHACVGVNEKNLKGADIYVIRARRDNTIGLAKPCSICQCFLRELGIRRVYFSNNDGSFSNIKL